MNSPSVSPPLLLVLAGPFACGKSSIQKKLIGKIGLEKCVTVTTRPPRPDEVDGVDYIFKSEKEFQTLITSGAFIEYEIINERHYGTLKESICNALGQGKRLVTCIDVNGYQALQMLENDIVADSLFGIYIDTLLPTLIERARARPGGISEYDLNLRINRWVYEDSCKYLFDKRIENPDGALETNVEYIIQVVERRLIERSNDR